MKKTSKKIQRVAFFGDAEAKTSDVHFKDAFLVAKLLASEGYIICNGGGPGVMLASTQGAKEAKGKVEIVILKKEDEPGNYEGTDKNNILLADKIYEMPDISERTEKLIEIADAFVIFKGGTGTLAEIGIAWELARFDYGHHEPLVFYGSFWNRIVGSIIEKMEFTKDEQEVVTVVRKPEEVLKTLRRVGN